MSQSQSNDRSAEEQATGISILIADNQRASGVATLEQLGCTVDIDASLEGDSLARMIEEKDPVGTHRPLHTRAEEAIKSGQA